MSLIDTTALEARLSGINDAIAALVRELHGVRELLSSAAWNRLARMDSEASLGAAAAVAGKPAGLAAMPEALPVPVNHETHAAQGRADSGDVARVTDGDGQVARLAALIPAASIAVPNAAAPSPGAAVSDAAAVDSEDELLPRNRWLTRRRAAALDEYWPRDVPVAAIRARLAAMPGPPLPSNSAIATVAANRRLRRPDAANSPRLTRAEEAIGWARGMWRDGLRPRDAAALMAEFGDARLSDESRLKDTAKYYGWQRVIFLGTGSDLAKRGAANLASWERRCGAAFRAACALRPGSQHDGAPAPAAAAPLEAEPVDDGKVRIVRNTARPAPLPPRKPPPELARGVSAVPAHLVARDGGFSPARAMEAAAFAELQADPIALADALQWADRNRVNLCGSLNPVEQLRLINAARVHMGLSRWRLIKARANADPLPAPHIGAEKHGEYSKGPPASAADAWARLMWREGLRAEDAAPLLAAFGAGRFGEVKYLKAHMKRMMECQRRRPIGKGASAAASGKANLAAWEQLHGDAYRAACVSGAPPDEPDSTPSAAPRAPEQAAA